MNQQSTMRETLNRLNGVITGRRILNEGGVGQIADDLASLSDEEFQKEYGKSKADARKSFSGGEKKESVKEGMPADVIKIKQKLSLMTPDQLLSRFENVSQSTGKSVEELARSEAWRHGYGRNSDHYWKIIQKANVNEGTMPDHLDPNLNKAYNMGNRAYLAYKNNPEAAQAAQDKIEADYPQYAKMWLQGYRDGERFAQQKMSEARDGDINFGHGHTADPYFAYDKSNPEKFMRFKTRNGAKAYAEKQGWQIASAGFFYDNIKGKTAAKEGYDAGGAYDKWDPKHPEFMKNYKKFQASNPGSTLKDFIAQLKKGVNEVSNDTLMSYQKKVSADTMKNNMDPTKRSPEKRNRSVSGVAKAHNRLEKRMGEGLDASEDAVRVRGGQRFLFPEDGKLGYTTDGGGNEFTILDQETGEVRDISLDKLPDNPLQADLEHLLNQYDDEQFTSGASVPDWIKKSSSMWKESAEKQVDMTGKKCTSCKKGTYEETSQHDDMDGVLHCTKCRKEVKRHQTASPKKKGVSEASRGFRGVGGAREREDDERHDLDRSDWYIVKDGKLLKASIYPSQEAQAREEGFSPTREEARSKADKKVAKENFGGGMRDRPGSDDKQFDLAECRKFLKKRL